MVTAEREIKESLNLIDIVIEVLDARIPDSSRNPIVKKFTEGKKNIILLNKYDLADKKSLDKWTKIFEEQGYTVIKTNAQTGENLKTVIQTIKKLGDEYFAEKNKNKQKTLDYSVNNIYRAAIIGIPNVGKSTLINKLSGKNNLIAKNMPGVTRKKQWIRLDNNIELLDTPGLLWPKLGEKEAGVKLALTGNIKKEILDEEELALSGLKFFVNNEEYLNLLKIKYGIDKKDTFEIPEDEIIEGYEYLEELKLLNLIGKKRGFTSKGGIIDIYKAATCFLDDLKNGKIGNISLE